jgi:hypothetical protein
VAGLADHRGVARGAGHCLALLVSGGRQQGCDGPGVPHPGERLARRRSAAPRALASARANASAPAGALAGAAGEPYAWGGGTCTGGGDGKISQVPRTGENVRFETVSEFAGETITVRRGRHPKPHAMPEQFAREALRLYPQASILLTQREDLQADRRHQFIATVASRTTTICRPATAPFQGYVSGLGHR